MSNGLGFGHVHSVSKQSVASRGQDPKVSHSQCQTGITALKYVYGARDGAATWALRVPSSGESTGTFGPFMLDTIVSLPIKTFHAIIQARHLSYLTLTPDFNLCP